MQNKSVLILQREVFLESCKKNPHVSETDQIVLTITKALTKTTSCTFRGKKVEKQDQKIFFPRTVAPPHFQIRSGANA